MGKADGALSILRNRIGAFRNYGGKEETEINARLKIIGDEKYKIADSMLKTLDKKIGGQSRGYVVHTNNKLGKFDVIFYSFNTSPTTEEKILIDRQKKLKDNREQIYKLLQKKLDDISLKISISGLDVETTQLLKDFLKELEKIEG